MDRVRAAIHLVNVCDTMEGLPIPAIRRIGSYIEIHKMIAAHTVNSPSWLRVLDMAISVEQMIADDNPDAREQECRELTPSDESRVLLLQTMEDSIRRVQNELDHDGATRTSVRRMKSELVDIMRRAVALHGMIDEVEHDAGR